MWTDPATGDYTVALPQGHTYTLHIATSLPGYQPATRSVSVGDAPQTVDIPVPADIWAAPAAGYAVHLTGATEPFDSTDSAPQGWSVANADGTTNGWEFDDPGARGNSTGGDGAFAVVDIDTLWIDKADNRNHWKGRVCKVYSRIGDDWKMTMHTGVLDYSGLETPGK